MKTMSPPDRPGFPHEPTQSRASFLNWRTGIAIALGVVLLIVALATLLF
jgi:hypothetical protein